MADVLTAVVTRLDAILKGGRGADGSLGPLALARSIPLDRYRKAADNVSMRDLGYPVAHFDRAYRIEWGSLADTEEEGNVRADTILQTLACRVLLGHLYGDAHAAMLRKIGSEVEATIARESTERAVGDTVRVLRALRCSELWGIDTSPVIVDVKMNGGTDVEDLGDRLLTTIPLAVVLRVTQTGYEP